MRVLVPLASLAALALASGAALAQYKVVGPDGKVTYTDRAPATSEGRVVPLNQRTPVQEPEPELPFELRQVATRYPVTLYVVGGACEPCDAGRQLLRQRGIPFAEKQVVSAEDGEALQGLSGGREAPTLSVGTQVLRGLASDVWTSYLDAAGYPKQSKLPPNYAYRPATPLVTRASDPRPSTAPTARQQPPAPAPAPTAPAAPPPAAPGTIRF